MIQNSEFLQSLRPEFEPGVAVTEAAPVQAQVRWWRAQKQGCRRSKKPIFESRCVYMAMPPPEFPPLTPPERTPPYIPQPPQEPIEPPEEPEGPPEEPPEIPGYPSKGD